MTNHLHMIIGAESFDAVHAILRDFKKFTSKKILAELCCDDEESRREWMLKSFERAGAKDKKISSFRFWQEGCYTEVIYSLDFSIRS